MFVNLFVRPCVCHKMFNYVLRTNDWTYKRQFLHTYASWQDTCLCQFSSQSSTSLTFNFKVKYLNSIHLRKIVHEMRLSLVGVMWWTIPITNMSRDVCSLSVSAVDYTNCQDVKGCQAGLPFKSAHVCVCLCVCACVCVCVYVCVCTRACARVPVYVLVDHGETVEINLPF